MKKLFYLCLGFLFLTSSVMAGPNGKITGYVKDKGTGEVLPGVNVIIDGTTMGAATNARGEFSIINVPAGVYTLRASMIGYSKTSKQNIRVLPDFTTKVDFDLAEESVSGEEVVIVADRPLLQRDQTMTMAVTGSEEIKNLPVRGFQAVANLGTGITLQSNLRNLDGGTGTVSVRGGRPSETGVYLDGFLQNNLLTGVSNVQVSNSAVEEIMAITGGFNAEYGRNQSGIIQVITKSGRQKYSGNIEYVSDGLAGAVKTGVYGYSNVSGGFGGPIIPGNNKFRFFVSGEYQLFDDADPNVFGQPYFIRDTTGREGYTISDRSLYTQKAYEILRYDTILFTDKKGNVLADQLNPIYRKKGARPHRQNAQDYYTFQGKMTFDILSNLRFDLSGNYGETVRKVGNNTRMFAWEHNQRRENRYYQAGGIFTYTINEKNFIDFGGNYNYSRQRIMSDEFGWNINWGTDTRDSLTRARDNNVYGGRLGRFRGAYQSWGFFNRPGSAVVNFNESLDEYIALKANYIGQVTKHHQIKAGADFYRHTVRMIQCFEVDVNPATGDNNYIGYRVLRDTIGSYNGSPIVKYRIKKIDKDNYDYYYMDGTDTISFPLDGAKHPVSYAFYLQDKMEYEGVIVNAGIRADFFNAGTKRLKNLVSPFGADRLVSSDDFESSKTQMKLSPRLSVSFPVSEKTIFRMSYGKFFQQPDLQNLYISSLYLYNTATGAMGGGIRSVQNPNLQAEESTQYEVGLQRALTDNFRIDVSAYYKDINGLTNLVNAELDETVGYKGYPQYTNDDRGIIKGISIALDLRRVKKFSGRLAYTIQTAEGTGSDPDGAFNAIWTDGSTVKFITPLDYDQRHRINMNLDIRNGKKEGPSWGNYILQDAGANFLISAGSGLPYTLRGVEQVGTTTANGRIISRRNALNMPWTFRVDMKLDKSFDVTHGISMGVYIQVMNLFDRKNVQNVYPATGSADDDGFLTSDMGRNVAAGYPEIYKTFYKIRMKNGLFYDTPRQVRAGVFMNF